MHRLPPRPVQPRRVRKLPQKLRVCVNLITERSSVPHGDTFIKDLHVKDVNRRWRMRVVAGLHATDLRTIGAFGRLGPQLGTRMIHACNRYFRPHNMPPRYKSPHQAIESEIPTLGNPPRRVRSKAGWYKKPARKRSGKFVSNLGTRSQAYAVPNVEYRSKRCRCQWRLERHWA